MKAEPIRQSNHLFHLFLSLGIALHGTLCLAQQPSGQVIDQFQAIYLRARSLHRVEKFDSAIILYKQCRVALTRQKITGMDADELSKRIMECESGKNLMLLPRKFVVTNLGKSVNSPYEDYAPVLTADERLLVFTSRRPDGNLNDRPEDQGKYFEDVFIAYRAGTGWSVARNIGQPVNTPFHDSNLALSSDGKQLFLYTDQNEGDILVSDFIDGAWSKPWALPSPINTPYHESSVSLSADGKKLFFASERPGGKGGSDIYVAEKNKYGQWGQAMNLGLTVNSQWDEDSPFIDFDETTLYFSSTGHNTMGGFDIFRSVRKSGEWSAAENLGFPINTPGPDSYFVSTKDGKRAYYSSVRPEGFGEEDIYLITLPAELIREREEVVSTASPETLVIYFPFGSSLLSAADRQRLDSLSAVLGQPSDLCLQIDGHTDDIGLEKFNQSLSLARAQVVRSYFESKGTNTDRITVKGWSSGRPLVSNVHEKDARRLNRRVEIRVIQK